MCTYYKQVSLSLHTSCTKSTSSYRQEAVLHCVDEINTRIHLFLAPFYYGRSLCFPVRLLWCWVCIVMFSDSVLLFFFCFNTAEQHSFPCETLRFIDRQESSGVNTKMVIGGMKPLTNTNRVWVLRVWPLNNRLFGLVPQFVWFPLTLIWAAICYSAAPPRSAGHTGRHFELIWPISFVKM